MNNEAEAIEAVKLAIQIEGPGAPVETVIWSARKILAFIIGSPVLIREASEPGPNRKASKGHGTRKR